MFSRLVVACGFGLSFRLVDHYIDLALVCQVFPPCFGQWAECFPSLRGWRALSGAEFLDRWAVVCEKDL